jgi:hypothetical protein
MRFGMQIQITSKNSVGTSHNAKQTTHMVSPEQAMFIHYSSQTGCLYIHTSATESTLTVEAPVSIG